MRLLVERPGWLHTVVMVPTRAGITSDARWCRVAPWWLPRHLRASSQKKTRRGTTCAPRVKARH